jgi:hypothetical protein
MNHDEIVGAPPNFRKKSSTLTCMSIALPFAAARPIAVARLDGARYVVELHETENGVGEGPRGFAATRHLLPGW